MTLISSSAGGMSWLLPMVACLAHVMMVGDSVWMCSRSTWSPLFIQVMCVLLNSFVGWTSCRVQMVTAWLFSGTV